MIVFEDGYIENRPEDGRPDALPQVEVTCSCDEFENAIRKFGVLNACEWFGVSEEFFLETVKVLKERGNA